MGEHQAGLDHFKSVPWSAKIISKPGTNTFVPSNRDSQEIRRPGQSVSQDTLLRSSLKTADAIPHCVGVYHDSAVASTSPAVAPAANSIFYLSEITLLCRLEDGTKGYSGNVHGGLTGVLIDESMGNLLYHANKMYQELKISRPNELPPGVMDLDGVIMLTAGMNIRFVKPLPTPSVVAVVSKLSKIDGRKVFIDVTVEGEDGFLFAKALGEWRAIPFPKKKI